jgi:hypothetical protein
MAGTTRELNFGAITVASAVFVLLLVAIVAGAEAWFRYEVHQKNAQLLEEYPVNRDLAALNAQQREQLAGSSEGTLSIDEAMQQIAERY